MGQIDPKALRDGFTSLEGGVNTVQNAETLPRTQVVAAINRTFRGAFSATRPGAFLKTLRFDTGAETTFRTGRFQDGMFYQKPNGQGELLAQISGRTFRLDVMVDEPFVEDISIPGDLNASNRWKSWMIQAEDFALIQDESSPCLIWDGSSLKRSNPAQKGIPVGGPMHYGLGRLWVARGREYLGSDIVGGPTGTAMYNYRDSILSFEENQYLDGGGAFSVPQYAGKIRGFETIAQMDTALGEGGLVIFCDSGTFINDAPFDRTVWQALTVPIQRVAIPGIGAFGGIVQHNGDIYFRSGDSVRSLITAVRNFGDPGNTSISREMTRYINCDTGNMLEWCHAVVFDGRLLMAGGQEWDFDHGVCHRHVMSLDFDLVSTMKEKLPPAWEGIWRFQLHGRILKIVVGVIHNQQRCWIFMLDDNGEIQLVELSSWKYFENENDVIEWELELPEYNCESPFNMKQLWSGDVWMEDMAGTTEIAVYYRSDQSNTWKLWDEWTETAPVGNPFPMPIGLDKPQFRTRKRLPRPDDGFEDDDNQEKPINKGYSFASKLIGTGHQRFKKFRIVAHDIDERISPEKR